MALACTMGMTRPLAMRKTTANMARNGATNPMPARASLRFRSEGVRMAGAPAGGGEAARRGAEGDVHAGAADE